MSAPFTKDRTTDRHGLNPLGVASLARLWRAKAGDPGSIPLIRPAVTADLATLVALNAQVQSIHAEALPEQFRGDPPAAEVTAIFAEKLADPAAFWLLAELDGTSCGYLYARFGEHEENWARPARRVCNITHLAVHPKYRRRGVARALIDAAVAEATHRGFARIELDVWSFNVEAREAFRQLGFVVFNERMELKRP